MNFTNDNEDDEDFDNPSTHEMLAEIERLERVANFLGHVVVSIDQAIKICREVGGSNKKLLKMILKLSGQVQGSIEDINSDYESSEVAPFHVLPRIRERMGDIDDVTTMPTMETNDVVICPVCYKNHKVQHLPDCKDNNVLVVNCDDEFYLVGVDGYSLLEDESPDLIVA
jgi:hypothetical protein